MHTRGFVDKLLALDTAPIFILANPRSGSTLLRLMLTCHPDIAIPPEGGFIIGLWDKYRSYSGEPGVTDEFVKDLLAVRKMEFWKIKPSSLREYFGIAKPTSYGELVAGVYGWYANTHGEKSRWGDKNNFYIRELDKLYDLFPAAWYIHLVRDGRDVACSYREVRRVAHGKYAPVLPGDLADTALAWAGAVDRIEAFFAGRSGARYVSVRYEDLVLRPQATLENLCDRLGVEYSADMLNFAERNRRDHLEPEEFDTWKSLNREELTQSRVERWKREFFVEDAVLFEKIAGRELARYGYARVGDAYETRRARLKLWGTLVGALALALRIKRVGMRWRRGIGGLAQRRRVKR